MPHKHFGAFLLSDPCAAEGRFAVGLFLGFDNVSSKIAFVLAIRTSEVVNGCC